MRHGRPLRFMARQANCFAPLTESAESITRKAYDAFDMKQFEGSVSESPAKWVEAQG